MEILKYKIVVHDSETSLENEVNKEIKNGWQPLGGLEICQGRICAYYYQSMIYVKKRTRKRHTE